MIGDIDDFEFYLKFSKPLVLNLPDAKDRTIAALWVKKLRDMQSDGPEANMRIEYLKLLLFVMQRNKLTGIFEKAPPDGPLQGFPPNYKATEMMSLVKPGKSLPPVYPPVFTSVGGDLRQFVAVQEIPNFGLHGYYAISTEPLSKWSHASTNAARKTAMKPKHFADCFKDTCKLAETTESHKKCKESDPPVTSLSLEAPETQEQQPEASGDNSEKIVESKGANKSTGKTRQQNDCEKTPGPTTQFVPLPSIPFQSFRKEIAGFESRPTWGRSRYIERLIDESPHLAADLDMSEADALLRVMGDKIFKKADNYGPCAISETRRHVERMLDLPPCAADPGEMRPTPGPMYTCCPKREKFIDTSCVDACLSERDFYPCGGRSLESLRGGSDSGSCCAPRNEKPKRRTYNDTRNNNTNPGRPYFAPKLSSTRHGKFSGREGLIFDDTDEPSDIDTSIHDATTRTKYIDPDKSGNFKWLEEVEHITLSDPTEMSFTESDSRSRIWSRPFSSDTMTNEFYQPETEGCSEFDDGPPINEQLEPEELMPQVAQRMHSSRSSHPQRSRLWPKKPSPNFCSSTTYGQDSWELEGGRTKCGNEDAEPSIAVVRRRFARSRKATNRKPEIHEKSYRWKEIIDQTEPSRGQTSFSKGARRTSNLDPEYLDYIEAVKTDRGYCCEDEDEEVEEEPHYSGRAAGHALDEEMARYTQKLLRPPKPPPSSGKVTMPLSKQNRRRPMAQEMEYREQSDENVDEDKSD